MRKDQEGAYTPPARSLPVACTLPVRLLCSAQAASRHGPPASQEVGLFQWLHPCAEWQARGRRAGVAHPWPTHGPGMAQAAHRPGLGPSQVRCSDGRENLQGKYGRKIVLDVHGRKRFIRSFILLVIIFLIKRKM